MKFETDAANVKAAAPWGKRNCCTARTFFVLAGLMPHGGSLTTGYESCYEVREQNLL
jgi:hypothetical protein